MTRFLRFPLPVRRCARVRPGSAGGTTRVRAPVCAALALAVALAATPAATAAPTASQPMGEAKGIFPGRVVWVHGAAAVNQACVADAPGHGWYLPENQNQPVIDAMVSRALRDLTGAPTDRAAWSAIFRYHNATRGKGATDYVRGEKIFLKLNATSAYAGNFDPADLTPRSFVSETSVGVVRAVLRQLVGVVGVDPRDISVGDPLKHIYRHLYETWHAEFPEVHYLGNGGYTSLGRETVVPSATAVLHYSDRGSVLRTNVWSNGYPGDDAVTEDHLYRVFETAEYLINLPMLKGHRRAGVTMFAKNHFGSHTRADASHLHNGLVAPTETIAGARSGYGLYRVQVDIMGHALLGRKNLLYLMDALWATDHELDVPLKWQSPPFSNTYMASIFASLDPVAIESVGYDFLRAEFTAGRSPPAGTYVQMDGVDDYLHQAADPANWPAGIRYDPDASGTPLGSLGAHEHWNNATAKQYSRNLARAGAGIELIQDEQALRADPVASRAVAVAGSVSFTARGDGTPPLTYRWQRRTADGGTWADLADGGAFLGAATGTLTIADAAAGMNGDQFRCLVTDAAQTAATTNAATLYVLSRGAGRLANLATRAYCGLDDHVTIGGFVITGAPKRVLVRAVGPSLAAQGLATDDLLANPLIELHDARRNNALVGQNDNWGDNANADEIRAVAAAIGAAPFTATDTTSAALLLTLPAGPYTFVVRGGPGAAGVVLGEVYEVE